MESPPQEPQQEPAPEVPTEAPVKDRFDALDIHEPSPADKKIEAALNSPAQLEFVKTPLQDVVEHLKDRYHIEVQLDKTALDDVGIGADTPVTKSFKGMTLRAALRLMLHDLKLTYIIQNEVLLITTPETAEARLTTVVYPVADLLEVGRDENGNVVADFDSLIDMITSTVQPTTWDAVGGPGSIARYSVGTALSLVISQTQEVHEEIADVLKLLRKVKNAGPTIAFSQRGPADKKIEESLNSPTTFEFVETPLNKVAEYLAARHHIKVELDKTAMADVGIALDTPVTKNLKGISLRSALQLMLSELKLTYIIQDGELLITTPETADAHLTTLVYPVGELVEVHNAGNGIFADDFESLIDLITSTVQPTTWDAVGGPGSIVRHSVGKSRALVISQTQEVHDEIAALLETLRKFKKTATEHGGVRTCRLFAGRQSCRAWAWAA